MTGRLPSIDAPGGRPNPIVEYFANKMDAAGAAARSGAAGVWLFAVEVVHSITGREPDYAQVARNTKTIAAIQQGAEISALTQMKTEGVGAGASPPGEVKGSPCRHRRNALPTESS